MEWEYRSFTRECRRAKEGDVPTVDHKRIDLELNALGTEGWELVSVVPIVEEGLVDSMTYFLRRERDEVRTRALIGAEC